MHQRALPLYLLAEGSSLFGNAAIGIVLPWLVLARTGDPALAGLVAAVAAVPSILAAVVGGHLIDLIGRKRISVIADLGSAAAVAALAVVDLTAGLNLGWFIVLGICGAIFDVPGFTARETLMADVARVGRVGVERISGLRQIVVGVSFLAGPGLAGVLLTAFDPIQVVWLTAGCSFLAAMATLALPIAMRPQAVPTDDAAATTPTGWRAMLEGWTAVRASSALLGISVLSLAISMVLAPLLAVILPAWFAAADRPGELGATLSAFAVGTMLGSLGYAVAGRRITPRRLFVVSIVVMAVGFGLLATLAGFVPILIAMAVMGLGSGLINPLFPVYLSTRIPERLRGRVMGLIAAINFVGPPLGLGAVALLLGGTTLQVTAVILVVGWLALTVWALLSRGLRRFTDELTPAADVPVTPEPEVSDRVRVGED